MAGKIINFYPGGNTAKGFYSLFESSLQGLDRLFILKGGPGTGKSSLMKSVGKDLASKGFDIQFLHCSSDNRSIDGVIIPELSIGIVDGTAPHVIEPKLPGVVEEYINLGVAWNSKLLQDNKEEIKELNEKLKASFQKAHQTFAEALTIHDEWEKIYIQNMNFAKLDQLTEELIEKFFANQNVEKKSDVRHRFLGAATPQGAVDFIQNLTEDIAKRYFVKGRPGTGKSTMLKKIGAAAENKGYDVEIYHCGFDPNSFDMIIVRELGIAIFDSTAPHEYFPERETDEIVNVYAWAVTPGTDEKYAAQLQEIKGRYSSKMSEGTSYLAQAKLLHDDLEKIYVQAMDFDKVTQIKKDILLEINHFAEAAASREEA